MVDGAGAQGGSSEALGPIADQIQAILAAAAAEIQHLTGQPMDIILGAADGVGQVTAEDLARLTTDLLKQVVGALGHLRKALGPKIGKLIHDLLRDLLYGTSSFLQTTVLTMAAFIFIVRQSLTCCAMSSPSSLALMPTSYLSSTYCSA